MSHGTSLSTKGRVFRAVENATRGVIFAGMVVPTLLSVSPSSGMQGQSVKMTLTGKNLNVVTTISFGAGITFGVPESKTKTEIIVWIVIDPDAVLGFRDVSVSTTKAVSTLTDAFEVLSRYAEVSTGGGAGGMRGRLVPVTVIKKRKYLDDAIAIKVHKDGTIRYELAVGISKRIETSTPVHLAISQTLLDSSFITLAVDKQGDIAGMQILEGRTYEGEFQRKAFIGKTKETEYDVEALPPEEMHTLTVDPGYNDIAGRVYEDEKID